MIISKKMQEFAKKHSLEIICFRCKEKPNYYEFIGEIRCKYRGMVEKVMLYMEGNFVGGYLKEQYVSQHGRNEENDILLSDK